MPGCQDSIDFFCDVVNGMVKVSFEVDYVDGKYEVTRPLKNGEYICLQAVHPVYCMECSGIPQIKMRIEEEIMKYFNNKYK